MAVPTLWGATIAAGCTVAPDIINNAASLGPHVEPVVSEVGHVLAIAGAAWAAYGRFAATATLTS